MGKGGEMATVYLIRHGQAGPAEDYDRLSPLGMRQARLLGRYLKQQVDPAGQGIERVVAGGLRRQQETARCLVEEIGQEDPLGDSLDTRVQVDSRWNEFDLFRVYHQLGPILAAGSPAFAADWAEMKRERAADPHTSRGATGRCDRAIIEAWIEDRYPLPDGTETWPTFRQRVQAAWEGVGEMATGSRLAIVTSAAPIALTVGLLLSVPDDRILQLMTVLYNSGLTVLRWRTEAPLLISFNTTPHLSDPTVRTFR